MGKLNALLNVPVVGASGAVYGVLLGFGVLFPNTQLMLIFPPIPIKAKYLVIGYAAIELYSAITAPGSGIAHTAHLGGMIFGYLLIRYWRKTTTTLY
jgi:membrane associated rhomboid family serine protease